VKETLPRLTDALGPTLKKACWLVCVVAPPGSVLWLCVSAGPVPAVRALPVHLPYHARDSLLNFHHIRPLPGLVGSNLRVHA